MATAASRGLTTLDGSSLPPQVAVGGGLLRVEVVGARRKRFGERVAKAGAWPLSRLRARWLVDDGDAIAVRATRPTRGVVSGERRWGCLKADAAVLVVIVKTQANADGT